MLRHYRPAGNKIVLKSSLFDKGSFSPNNIHFFQSGTASLAASIIACCKLKDIAPDQAEVLLPAYACPDLISAVLYSGASPVLVDLERNTTFLSLTELESHITNNTVAIIAVNFLGISERTGPLKSISQSHDLYLINDSAQWFPRHPGNMDWPGDFNVISFGRGKPVNLLHGGAVITKQRKEMLTVESIDLSPINKKNALTSYFKVFVYNQVIRPWIYGLISRLPGLGIGDTKFVPLTEISKMDDKFLSLLDKNLEAYSSRGSTQKIIRERLKEFANSKVIDLCPVDFSFNESNLLRYPILITEQAARDSFYEKAAHLGVSLMYRCPLHEIKGLELLASGKKNYINATRFANQLVTLPTHEDIKPWIIHKIFDLLETSLAQTSR